MQGIVVEEYLEKNNIDFVLHEHPAVYTSAEAEVHTANIPGLNCKNLLLKDQKSKRFFLLILPADVKADLQGFAKVVNEKKLSFANSGNLKELLAVEPGSVSPFGLLNDVEKKVEVYIHQKVKEAEAVKFHPNRNTASLELTKEMFNKYLNLTGHEIHILSD